MLLHIDVHRHRGRCRRRRERAASRKGDTNHPGLATWPKFNAEQRATMIFNDTCEVKNDPDRELRLLVSNG